MDQSARAQDRHVDVKRWLTILPLWKWCQMNVKTFPQLQGLCQQLGVVIRAHIAANASKRGQIHTVPTGNADEDELRAFLVQNPGILSDLAREGNRNLSVQTLVRQYPRTWDGQADASSQGPAMAAEVLVPDKYAGLYYLPLGIHTSPIQAVRMGVVFLQEWAKLEDFEYELELKLS